MGNKSNQTKLGATFTLGHNVTDFDISSKFTFQVCLFHTAKMKTLKQLCHVR